MAREYEQLKATVATLQMFQHDGEKAITPLAGSKLTSSGPGPKPLALIAVIEASQRDTRM